MNAAKTRYRIDHNGTISRNGEHGTEWVEYIRFCGDRAEAIAWTRDSSEAAKGWDQRAMRAVRYFNRRRATAR